MRTITALLAGAAAFPLLASAQNTCEPPTIIYPSEGDSLEGVEIYVAGTITPPCTGVRLFLNDEFSRPVDSGVSCEETNEFFLFTLASSTLGGNGGFEVLGKRQEIVERSQSITVESFNPTDDTFEPSRARSEFTISQEIVPCGQPTLVQPSSDEVFGETVVIEGSIEAVEDGTNCQVVSVFINEEQVLGGEVEFNEFGEAVIITFTNGLIPDGVNSAYITLGSGSSLATSNTIQLNVQANPCPAPIISAPTSGQVFGTRFPVFEGTMGGNPVACTGVAVEVNGQMVGMADRVGDAWVVNYADGPGTGLPDGDHEVRAMVMAISEELQGAFSEVVEFAVAASEGPTVSIVERWISI